MSRTRTPLHFAAEENETGAVDALVEAGADVEALYYDDKSTPLHYAAWHGSCDALRHRADVDAKGNYGERPLHNACHGLHQEAAGILLRWGAGEASANDTGFSAEDVIAEGLGGDDL